MLIFELCGYKVFSTSENIHVPYFFFWKINACLVNMYAKFYFNMNYQVYLFLQYKNLYTSRIWYPEVNIFVV